MSETPRRRYSLDLMSSLAQHTVEHGSIHALQHGLKKGMVQLLAPELLSVSAMAFGIGLHTIAAAAGATLNTVKANKMLEVYTETGGTRGFSRTRRNKEVATSWTSAAFGAAGAVGAAAFVGQVDS